MIRDGFVLRHDPRAITEETDQQPIEGAFLACSLWLADAYVLAGDIAKAQALFDRVVAVANDLGLLAEEYDSGERRQTGNFPQALTHIALINTAHNLSDARGAKDKPVVQRWELARSCGQSSGVPIIASFGGTLASNCRKRFCERRIIEAVRTQRLDQVWKMACIPDRKRRRAPSKSDPGQRGLHQSAQPDSFEVPDNRIDRGVRIKMGVRSHVTHTEIEANNAV